MGKKKKWVIFLLPGLVILLLVLALIFNKTNRSNFLTNEQRKEVKVERRDFRQTVVSSGTVKPQVGARVKVGSRVSGKVEKLFVQTGDTVEKGQVVAIIEHEDLDAKLKQAKARLHASEVKLSNILSTVPREIDQAKADIKEKEARIELARLELKRQRALLKQAFVPQEGVDKALREVKVLKAQLASVKQHLLFLQNKFIEDQKLARAQIEEASAGVKIASINRSYATIRAPIGGVVGSVSTQEGETVAASLNAPTFITLIDLSRLQVDDFVDETDIGRVKIGQEAMFTVDTFPDKVFHAKVTAIRPIATIQENVVYYDVVISINDSYEEILRPEMTTNVTIITDIIPHALAIPVDAIVREGKKEYVALKGPTGSFEKRAVLTGIVDGDFVEIKKGLKEGDIVLVGSEAKKLLKQQ